MQVSILHVGVIGCMHAEAVCMLYRLYACRGCMEAETVCLLRLNSGAMDTDENGEVSCPEFLEFYNTMAGKFRQSLMITA